MSNVRVATAALLWGGVWAAGTAAAQSCVVDQSQLISNSVSAAVGPAPGLSAVYTRAQTLVVGMAGTVEAIEVILSPFAEALQEPVVADIRPATQFGRPTGDAAVLASVARLELTPGGLQPTSFDFSSAGIDVVPGDGLAIVLTSPVDGMWWRGAGANPYPNGRSFWHTDHNPTWQASQNVDLYFRVIVCPDATPVEATTWGRIKASYR